MNELERILLRLDAEGIAYLRKTLGVSQEKMARSLGVSVQSVRRWEHDKAKPIQIIRREIGEVYGDVILSDPFYQKYLSMME